MVCHESASTLVPEGSWHPEDRLFILVRTGTGKEIGVAQYRNGESAMDTFQHADLALYEAKREGRNRIAAWQSGP